MSRVLPATTLSPVGAVYEMAVMVMEIMPLWVSPPEEVYGTVKLAELEEAVALATTE